MIRVEWGDLMVPDKFNMVDMGGIDLIMMQGEAVPGLYDKLMAAISNCQYQCLYHWMFDSVLIPPTYVQMTVVNGEIFLNGGVSVTSDDVIHIYTLSPGPTPPAIIPLLAEENGTYNVPAGVDGFDPVTVDVPSYTPVIDPITITENGTYTAPSGVDGYSPITVDVSAGGGYSETIHDYAQFIGSFNGIQLPFYFDENTGIEIEFMLTSTAQWQMIFGTWDTEASGNILWNRATNDSGSSGPLYIGTGTLNGQEGKSVPNLFNTKHTIKTNVNGHSYVDDTIEYSYTPTAPGRQIKNVVGGNRLSGGYSNFAGRIYSYKIYNRSTEVLVCSLIPVTITIGNSSFDALKDVINSTYYISSNIETLAGFICDDD